MKIVEIEVHQIGLEYHDWLAYAMGHYYGPMQRTVYVAHTDNGLEGLGESGTPEPSEVVDRYVGTNPFDWIGDETSLGLGTAIYDLMGQAAGVPVHRLFGQRYRAWVPVGSWTVSTHPDRMAEAVRRYAAQGYTWLKYHLSPFENVFDQTRAMEAVAPAGFRVQYDFTMGGTTDPMPALLERLADSPIAGCFEDPLPSRDIEGYRELRQRSRLPIVLHHAPLGAGFEVLMRIADAYILGHSRIGDAIRRAGLFAAGEIPFTLQNVGGTITRAMTTHMMAAFPSATFHFHSDTEIWRTDVTREALEPVNGLLRVPDGPGLGVTLDRDALTRLSSLAVPPQPRWILRTRFASGAVMYNLTDPKDSLFMVRPDARRLAPTSFEASLSTEYWDDDGSAEYRAMLARLEREGMVLESPALDEGCAGG
ncbi:MAG: enolase C-terminal domain-like protein [Candidatus Latescibacterota bacterium]|jgi:L-alanine-DL-glutamate epimerase-like enolase superfamily enzyme